MCFNTSHQSIFCVLSFFHKFFDKTKWRLEFLKRTNSKRWEKYTLIVMTLFKIILENINRNHDEKVVELQRSQLSFFKTCHPLLVEISSQYWRCCRTPLLFNKNKFEKNIQLYVLRKPSLVWYKKSFCFVGNLRQHL